MLDPSEVVDGQCHLAIYGPHYACIHCGPEDLVVYHLTILSESLINHGFGGEEEDDYGTKNSITHPTKNPRPPEEDVLYSLLI